jgi:hypothetical protein
MSSITSGGLTSSGYVGRDFGAGERLANTALRGSTDGLSRVLAKWRKTGCLRCTNEQAQWRLFRLSLVLSSHEIQEADSQSVAEDFSFQSWLDKRGCLEAACSLTFHQAVGKVSISILIPPRTSYCIIACKHVLSSTSNISISRFRLMVI